MKATDLALYLGDQVNTLMPEGKPDFEQIEKRPSIKQLTKEFPDGRNEVRKAIMRLVKNFCDSLNLIRPMSDMQQVEVAVMLLEECGDFRLEDYVIMFAMGKRGQLVKIMDRVDINIISMMHDEYYKRRRHEAMNRLERYESDYGIAALPPVEGDEKDIRASERFSKLVGMMTAWQGEKDDIEPVGEPLGLRLKNQPHTPEQKEKYKAALEKRKLQLEEKRKVAMQLMKGVQIEWLMNVKDKKGRMSGVVCKGTITERNDDAITVVGETAYKKQVEDYLSVNDQTITIIKK